jgi:Zn-dependent protease with chaperone function
MIPDEFLKELDKGLKAFQQLNYPEAVHWLEQFSHHYPDQKSSASIQARMALVRAYRGLGETDKAIALCEGFVNHPQTEVSEWARNLLSILQSSEGISEIDTTTYQQAGRFGKNRVRLMMPRVADSLKFAMAIAVVFHLGLMAAIVFGCVWLIGFRQIGLLWTGAIALSFLINLMFWVISPQFLDYLQEKLYGVEWINLGEVRKYSPETADLLLHLCREQKIALPRLGLISDRRPLTYSYGIRRNQSRLIVSKGIFRYLVADEIATLYAHELGHILHRDGSIMTFLAAWGQVFFAPYVYLQTWGQQHHLSPALLTGLTLPFYGLFQLNQALNRSFSRTREYYADRFAVENTGNPNGLLRALVKTSQALVKQDRKAEQPGFFLAGMGLLAVYDYRTATVSERRPSPRNVGRLFFWDMVNPWGEYLELFSTHPLPGKRLQVLTYYAEQLDLETEYHLNLLRREAKQTQNSWLYLQFFMELTLLYLPLLGGGIAWLLRGKNAPYSMLILGIGLGFLIQSAIIFLNFLPTPTYDLLTLMGEVKQNPLGLRKYQCQGKIRKTGDGEQLYFSDKFMVMPLYLPRWYGYLNQLLLLLHLPLQTFTPPLEKNVQITAHFHRSLSPHLVLDSLKEDEQVQFFNPAVGKLLLGLSLIGISFILGGY